MVARPTPRDGLQPLDDDLIGQRRQVAQAAAVGTDRDRHDRLVVRIEAGDHRLVDLGRECRRATGATFSRTSCTATGELVDRSNSILTIERPS